MSVAPVCHGALAARSLVARYQELQNTGFLALLRNGGVAELRTLEPQVVHLFHSGREDLFIRKEAGGFCLQGLPHRFEFPPVLALRGSFAALEKIHVRSGSDQVYIRLDQLAMEETRIAESSVTGAYEVLGRLSDDDPPISPLISGVSLQNNRVALIRGGEFLLAARERGDTHLLVTIRSRVGEVQPVEAEEVEIVSPKPPKTRSELYQRTLQGMDAQTALAAIKRASSAPELLADFMGLIDMDHHPQAGRIALFLEMIVRHGFSRAGRSLPPEKTLVAVIGFGDSLETIRVLLRRGYHVVAVEDFSSGATTTSKTSYSYQTVTERLAVDTSVERLRVMDFRDQQLPVGQAGIRQADVVLSAAVVDECYPTLVSLCKPGGIITATDSGQLDSRRWNFDVDRADSLIGKARLDGLGFVEIYSDLISGQGALESAFSHPRGQNSYIVRKI